MKRTLSTTFPVNSTGPAAIFSQAGCARYKKKQRGEKQRVVAKSRRGV